MRKVVPCKDCHERKLGCHGRCEKYQDWKAKVDEEMQARIRENAARPEKGREIEMRLRENRRWR